MTPRFTTADAARTLRMTPQGVRYLAATRQLPSERTRSGQYLFQPDDVVQLAAQRAHATLTLVRPHVVRGRREPRQLSLFGTRRLRLVDRFRPRVITLRLQSESIRDHSEIRVVAS